MMLSVLINVAMAVLASSAIAVHARKSPLKYVLRFYTVLSNLFCAAASVAVVIARLCGSVPQAVLIWKFVGTAAVSVTLLTVMFFLGPFVYNYRLLLTGPDLFLHLICPLFAIISLLIWDMPDIPFSAVPLGILPVLLYGMFYIYYVLAAPPDKRWKDFYGFNRDGRWYISLAAMLAGTFLISAVLWLVG